MLGAQAPIIRTVYRAMLVVLLLLVAIREGKAEQLPLRAYTIADGLPHNVVNKIVRDSHGAPIPGAKIHAPARDP